MLNLTKAQRRTVHDKFRQSPDGAKSYREFRKRIYPEIGSKDCVMLPWCGMRVGIEADGYPHT